MSNYNTRVNSLNLISTWKSLDETNALTSTRQQGQKERSSRHYIVYLFLWCHQNVLLQSTDSWWSIESIWFWRSGHSSSISPFDSLKPAQPVREQRLSCFLIFPTEPLWHYPPSHWLYWAAARVILMWLFSCGSTSFSLHNAFEVCVNVSWLHRVMWPWNCWFISVYIPQRQGLSPLTILT